MLEQNLFFNFVPLVDPRHCLLHLKVFQHNAVLDSENEHLQKLNDKSGIYSKLPYLSDFKPRLTLFSAFVLCGLLSRAVNKFFHRSISTKKRITQSVTTPEVNILNTLYELRTIEA